MATHNLRAARAARRDKDRQPHVFELDDDVVITVPHSSLWSFDAMELLEAERPFAALRLVAEGPLGQLDNDDVTAVFEAWAEAEGINQPGGSSASSPSSPSTGKRQRRPSATSTSST